MKITSIVNKPLNFWLHHSVLWNCAQVSHWIKWTVLAYLSSLLRLSNRLRRNMRKTATRTAKTTTTNAPTAAEIITVALLFPGFESAKNEEHYAHIQSAVCVHLLKTHMFFKSWLHMQAPSLVENTLLAVWMCYLYPACGSLLRQGLEKAATFWTRHLENLDAFLQRKQLTQGIKGRSYLQQTSERRKYSSDFSDVTRPAVMVLQIDVCRGMGAMAHARACDLTGSEDKL